MRKGRLRRLFYWRKYNGHVYAKYISLPVFIKKAVLVKTGTASCGNKYVVKYRYSFMILLS